MGGMLGFALSLLLRLGTQGKLLSLGEWGKRFHWVRPESLVQVQTTLNKQHCENQEQTC